MSPDVAIIGAGAAGIAAARTLRELGHSCIVLEASERIGGRAFTDAEGVDHGASWLHEADANPLVPLARALGVPLLDQGRRHKQGLRRGTEAATLEECVAYQQAIERMEARFEEHVAAGGPDLPASELAPHDGPFDATAAYWLGDIINGAPLSELGVRDYVAIALGGRNLQAEIGLGGLIERLAEGLPIETGMRIDRVRQDGAGLILEGLRGSVQARACIVTVSTGVLAAGSLSFTPDLPADVQAAIRGLPLGLLSKIVLRAAGADRLDLPAFGRVERLRDGPDDAPMSFICWPFGRDHVIGFIGGPAAWVLAREGPAAAEALARVELARHFGAARIAQAFRPGAIVTDWGTDPLHLGAYTHAKPGQAGARAVLRNAALADGRLRFAGEACHPRFAATLGGAWASGVEAAQALAATLGSPGRTPK